MDPYKALLDAARLQMAIVCFLHVPDDPNFDRHPHFFELPRSPLLH